ncbi:phosphotransferase [Vibrio amylolyticus]|uniref:phosphotransferase n=1 Tax=Vibrio amylolyticus TaxID=2847292 RepID=UPI00354DB4E5
MEELVGGRVEAIYRHGDHVVRPRNDWTPSVHQLLKHYQEEGVVETPNVLGISSESETLSFVEGDTYNYPLTGAIASQTAIMSAGVILRKLHDVSTSFVKNHNLDNMIWMLPKVDPVQVVCHGDFTPYNVALNGDKVIGVFDFDTAHPGSRLWDVAFSIYCWAPFKTDENDKLGTIEQQTARAKLFCDSYGLSEEGRLQLVDTIVFRLQSLVDYMFAEAKAGNLQFQRNMSDGHHLAYLEDIEYLTEHRKEITERVLS